MLIKKPLESRMPVPDWYGDYLSGQPVLEDGVAISRTKFDQRVRGWNSTCEQRNVHNIAIGGSSLYATPADLGPSAQLAPHPSSFQRFIFWVSLAWNRWHVRTGRWAIYNEITSAFDDNDQGRIFVSQLATEASFEQAVKEVRGDGVGKQSKLILVRATKTWEASTTGIRSRLSTFGFGILPGSEEVFPQPIMRQRAKEDGNLALEIYNVPIDDFGTDFKQEEESVAEVFAYLLQQRLQGKHVHIHFNCKAGRGRGPFLALIHDVSYVLGRDPDYARVTFDQLKALVYERYNAIKHDRKQTVQAEAKVHRALQLLCCHYNTIVGSSRNGHFMGAQAQLSKAFLAYDRDYKMRKKVSLISNIFIPLQVIATAAVATSIVLSLVFAITAFLQLLTLASVAFLVLTIFIPMIMQYVFKVGRDFASGSQIPVATHASGRERGPVVAASFGHAFGGEDTPSPVSTETGSPGYKPTPAHEIPNWGTPIPTDREQPANGLNGAHGVGRVLFDGPDVA